MEYKHITNVEVDGIDTKDYPDFCDAFISYAEYKGKEMTEEELEVLNYDSDFIHEQVFKKLF